MSLDELLALLPDNSDGEISAYDMRTVVTELFQAAHTVEDRFGYRYTTDATPPLGRIKLPGGWAVGAQTMSISETTDDGVLLTFGSVDNTDLLVTFTITRSTGAQLVGTTTDVSLDLGTYRTVPVTVTSVTGSAPSVGELVNMQIVVTPA